MRRRNMRQRCRRIFLAVGAYRFFYKGWRMLQSYRAICATLASGKTLTLHSNTNGGNALTRCSAQNGVGGAIYIDASKGSALTIQSTSFDSCSCKEHTRTVTSSDDDTTSEVSNTQFGKNVFITGVDSKELFLRSLWRGTVDSYETSSMYFYWVVDNANSDVTDDSIQPEKSVMDYLFPPSGVAIFISNDGNDVIGCGETEENPCKTIAYGPISVPSATHFILLGTTHDAETEVNAFTASAVYVIESRDHSSPITQPVTSVSSVSALFSLHSEEVVNAYLGIYSITFFITSLFCPLFHVGAGSLYLSSLTITPSHSPSLLLSFSSTTQVQHL